jgi:hypothetical protein
MSCKDLKKSSTPSPPAGRKLTRYFDRRANGPDANRETEFRQHKKIGLMKRSIFVKEI